MYILAWWHYSVRPFLRHSRRARRFLSAFCGHSVVHSHFAITSHWPLASLAMPARCLLRVRLGGFVYEQVDMQRNEEESKMEMKTRR